MKERSNNGDFKNLFDFINRVNPKDINKLQLEGLVQAGVFDTFIKNRQSLFKSIPNLILKSKNIHENKLLNQIDLFGDHSSEEINILEDTEDWRTDEKLTKEFETLGFYISDHPLNQYNSIFKQYNIINYEDFESNKDILSSNIACTILKVQEKKTQNGNSYAIIKFSDLSTVFELFLFSDIFEINREEFIEGNSLMLTLMKNYSDENKLQKRVNVKKIISLKKLINKPISKITLSFQNIEDLKKLSNLKKKDGETEVKFLIKKNSKTFTFFLKDKRKVNNELLNSLNLTENVVID